MLLSRENILNAVDIKTEVVSCPEWGGDVMVRGLTAQERDKLEQSLYTTKKHGNGFEVVPTKSDTIRVKLVVLTCVNENGDLIFTVADIDSLNKKSAAPIDRIFAVAQRLSGLTEKDVEELEKNS